MDSSSAAEAEILFEKAFSVLESSCLHCHGPNQQMAELRLDRQEDALAGGLNGTVYQAGSADDSLLFQRIASDEHGPQMPMGDDPLPPEDIEAIRLWIEQGAVWPKAGTKPVAVKKHWAYERPMKPLPPLVDDYQWASSPIDRFVLARLEDEGLEPSPRADKRTLIRRVSLDLVGLPPSPDDVEAFLADDSDRAYERMVNRLLSSPHFGERWAMPWLDLARYADSHGFEKDRQREIWPYRDWVIDALNEDKPYDQFTIEQLAGDLLPGSTLDQKIATGFHRNTMINEEGGVNQEQYRVEAVIDRVNTTSTVWLGTTMACAQCHDHKYDPFSQKDYYRFMAFFNTHAPEIKQIQSFEARAEGPTVRVPSDEEKELLDELEPQIAELDEILGTMTPELEAEMAEWIQSVRSEEAKRADEATEEQKGDLPDDLLAIVMKDERSDNETRRLELHWLAIAPSLEPIRAERKELADRLPKNIPTSMVMAEMEEPRPTYVLNKGSYLSPGEEVEPDVPGVLPPLPADAPRNRLGLARWLVDERNPLTARVFVNRIWEQIFGQGIVKSTEDLGTRSDPPSHPQLIDYLAVRFMQQGWSLKALLYEIVTSSTYKQSSNMTPGLIEKDPENRLLARGPRFRLPAEIIRDQALAASGLLDRSIGGPSVFPYQPPGIWQMPYSSAQWVMSENGDQYRRGLYTHMQRTAPYPAFLAFDAVSREVSCTRRIRTNTPLQALVTLNDPSYLEAARALAQMMIDEGGDDLNERINLAYQRCLARDAQARERERLKEFYQTMLAHYSANENDARALLKSGEDETPSPESAALTMTASVILNLDETLNKI